MLLVSRTQTMVVHLTADKEKKEEAETHWAYCRFPSLSAEQGWRNRLAVVGWCHWGGEFSGACVGAWRAIWHQRGRHTSPESRLSAAATSAFAPTTRHGLTNHVGSLRRTDPKQLYLLLFLRPYVGIFSFFCFNSQSPICFNLSI